MNTQEPKNKRIHIIEKKRNDDECINRGRESNPDNESNVQGQETPADEARTGLNNIQEEALDGQILTIPDKYGINRIPLADIIYIRAAGSYSQIFTTNGKNYFPSQRISKIEEMINNKTFLRGASLNPHQYCSCQTGAIQNQANHHE